jgi:hypothetical protein
VKEGLVREGPSLLLRARRLTRVARARAQTDNTSPSGDSIDIRRMAQAHPCPSCDMRHFVGMWETVLNVILNVP